jgi:ketosteroid isomerase-like protein
MGDGNSFVRLIDALRAELAALEAEDAEAIENATADKLAALQAVQDDMAAGSPPQRALLQEAQALNAEAALRARAKIISVEKRLAAVSSAAGKPAALVYGRNGRWA